MHTVIGDEAPYRSRQTEIPLSNVTGGILDYPEGNERTFPVLDALANVCISEPTGQVIAVGLQLQLQRGKICLTVAENGKVKEGVVEYLSQLWDILRQLSAKFAENRSYRGNPLGSQTRRVSPIMPPDVARDILIRLFRHICHYTRVKNSRRIARWLPDLRNFMERFYKARGIQFNRYEQDLHCAYQALRCAYQNHDRKPSSVQDDKYWQTLYSFMEVATFRVQRLTQDGLYFCDTLVSEIGMFFSLLPTLSPCSPLRDLECTITF